MKHILFFHAMAKFYLGLFLVCVLLFVPAGTFAYWQGWLLVGVLFVPMFIAGLWMLFRNPELLRKRLNAREQQGEQRNVVLYSILLFVSMFVVAGLNYRFRWLLLPDWTTYVATAVFLLGYGLYAEVLRENTWLSRTIEVQTDQQVIDTGLYGIVRHPMYTATLLMFLSMPLILNSVWSFALMLFYIPVIVKRIRNEERVLIRELNGYALYIFRVRYRLIPGIW